MILKVLEIRDDCTHIPSLAMQMVAENEVQAYYIHDRCGHPRNGNSIMLMMLDNGRATNDPYEWGSRTMSVAHNYIIDHFAELRDGDVVDVQYILGETQVKKLSERYAVALER